MLSMYFQVNIKRDTQRFMRITVDFYKGVRTEETHISFCELV
jgi:hypothetical protein